MSRATVYNTLDALCEAGLARKIPGTSGPGGNGSTRFDATTDEHMHVRCGKTGSLHDVPDDLGNKVMKSIPKKTLQQIESHLGFRINQVQIELIGEYDKQN